MKKKVIKIVLNSNKIITRDELFRRKEKFHKEQALLPFEEKIKILVQLQKLANSVKKFSRTKRFIWKISSK